MLEKLPDAVGHALRDQRAGLDHIAFHQVAPRAGMGALSVTSSAFVDHAPLAPLYTADGDGVSPPLQWSGVPAGADSVVLIVEDADSPTPRPLVHAIAVGIPADRTTLATGALNTDEGQADAAIRLGRNSYLQHGWLPPDPPPGHGTHRYAFQVFALAAGAVLPDTPGRDALAEAIEAHAIASGCLIGTYARPDGSVKASDGAAVAVPVAGAPDAGGLGLA